MNQKKDMRQIKAIEKANRERLLKVNPDLPDEKWWNREVDTQCKGKQIKVYRVVNGTHMEG